MEVYSWENHLFLWAIFHGYVKKKGIKGQIQVHFPKSDSGTMMSQSQQRSDNQIADFNYGSNVFNPTKTIQLIQWTKARHTPDQWCATTNTKGIEQETMEYSHHSGNASCSQDFQSRGSVHQSPVGDYISEAQQVVQQVPSI